MILFLFKYFTIIQLSLVFFLVALLCHLTIITIIHKRKKKDIPKESAQKDFVSFQIYFDRYYVTNIWYTGIMVMMYLILNIGLFFIFRLFLIGNESLFSPIESSFVDTINILQIVLLWISFIVSIIFYKSLLDLVFFTECIKLHHFLGKFEFYFKFQNYIVLSYLGDLLHNLHGIFQYLTATVENVEEYYAYYKSYDFAEIPENWEKLDIWRNRIQQSNVLFTISRFILYILDHRHNNLARLYTVPQVIFIILVITEFFSHKFYYIYYFLPVLIVIRMLGQYYSFLRQKSSMKDLHIMLYFYKNTIPYEKIRLNFFNNNNIIHKSFSTKETQGLIHAYHMQNLLQYIFNNFLNEEYINPVSYKERILITMEQVLIIVFFIVYNYSSTWSFPLYLLTFALTYIYWYSLIEKKDKLILRKHYVFAFCLLVLLLGFLYYLD